MSCLTKLMWKFQILILALVMAGVYLPFRVLDFITITVTTHVIAEDTRIHPTVIPTTAHWLRQDEP